MCEFTVLKKIGKDTEKIGEDVIFFQYSENGQCRLADIFGRAKIEAKNAFVYEINMLDSRHDITIIESELVPYFVRFMQDLQTEEGESKIHSAEQLITEIRKHLP
ncbi:MAG: CooT family nickel-binding protein [Candidatus Lokiarchaeota archaeon]|nr:CooT family nickel-binding protein [Candidatus Lokiarchaeota archaeon]